ncbi:MAG: GNAT family N-acetyltransferase [Arcanobacterium sp.]|nr:GNAT family N-acetyltransferase [Arcanobacterium sp.]
MTNNFNSDQYEIIHNEGSSQWELRLRAEDSVIGYLTYEIYDNQIFFTRLSVKKEFEGQGLGTVLAKEAIDYELELGENHVEPVCPFVQRVWEKYYA